MGSGVGPSGCVPSGGGGGGGTGGGSVNPCDSHPCVFGNCIVGSAGITCVCHPGYTGMSVCGYQYEYVPTLIIYYLFEHWCSG